MADPCILMHVTNLCPVYPLPGAFEFVCPFPALEPAYSVAMVASGAGVPLGEPDKQMKP